MYYGSIEIIDKINNAIIFIMSGHSKWATIHRQKEVTDAKKGALFTRIANAITIAARQGSDPEFNFKLKLAIDQAKTANMPKDNIQRAVNKGTGELKEGEQIEEVLYECFGPGGTTLVIECLTDNRNRTTGEIKHILSINHGSLGSPNSVLWQFTKMGVLKINSLTEEVELNLIDAGATDIEREEDIITVYCHIQNLQGIKKLLESKGIKVEYAEIELIPKDTITITDPAVKDELKKLFSDLDDNEDVNNHHTNADI